jgi:hypothetical protein
VFCHGWFGLELEERIVQHLREEQAFSPELFSTNAGHLKHDAATCWWIISQAALALREQGNKQIAAQTWWLKKVSQ